MASYVRAPQREAQLLEAAKAVLIRDGYQGLTLRAVAGEAGVRLSTLQHIFRTRPDLLRALEQKVIDDCGYTSFEMRERGLRIELQEAAQWYGRQVLGDPGMRELLRAELAANVGRRTDGAVGLPGQPLPHDRLAGGLQRMQDQGHELWSVPADQLAILTRHSVVGLTYDLLHTGDTAAYRADAASSIEALVCLADPQPRPAADRAA